MRTHIKQNHKKAKQLVKVFTCFSALSFFSLSLVHSETQAANLCENFYKSELMMDALPLHDNFLVIKGNEMPKIDERVSQIIEAELNLKGPNKGAFSLLIKDMDNLYEEAISSTKSSIYKQELLAWKKLQVLALSKEKSLEYQEYVKLSTLFVLIVDKINKSEHGSFERSHQIAEKIAQVLGESYPANAYIFTSRPLDIGAFNRISGEPIFYVGITTKTEHVDLTAMSPLAFFIHDLNHAAAVANQFGKKVSRGSINLGFREETIFQYFPNLKIDPQNLSAILTHIENNIRVRTKIYDALEMETDPLLKKAVGSIWFFLFHERQIPMTSKSIKKELVDLSKAEDDLLLATEDKMRDPSNWVYYFLRETMEHQDIRDSNQILTGLRNGIDWILKELNH